MLYSTLLNGGFTPNPKLYLKRTCTLCVNQEERGTYMAKRKRPKKTTILIKAERKHRITTREEMDSFLHMKNKGASVVPSGKVYKRKEKHPTRY